MDVVWTHRARQRLVDVYDYIAQDQPQNARNWLTRLIEHADSIGDQPWIGRKVPEYDNDVIREIFEGDYRIIYEVTPSRINILTIRHGSRPLPIKLSKV